MVDTAPRNSNQECHLISLVTSLWLSPLTSYCGLSSPEGKFNIYEMFVNRLWQVCEVNQKHALPEPQELA